MVRALETGQDVVNGTCSVGVGVDSRGFLLKLHPVLAVGPRAVEHSMEAVVQLGAVLFALQHLHEEVSAAGAAFERIVLVLVEDDRGKARVRGGARCCARRMLAASEREESLVKETINAVGEAATVRSFVEALFVGFVFVNLIHPRCFVDRRSRPIERRGSTLLQIFHAGGAAICDLAATSSAQPVIAIKRVERWRTGWRWRLLRQRGELDGATVGIFSAAEVIVDGDVGAASA